MGQKIHPYGLRLGIVTDWKSRWYSEKDYAYQVNQDADIRNYLMSELSRGAISRIDIERIGDKKVQIDVHTARPGVVIGRAGSEADRMRRGLEKLTDRMVKFNVIEVQNAELDATLLARSVADQLEGRVSFRRAMKRAVATALKAGAEGVRVQASGRLGGADMGRREWYLEGRVPLHTLRADIDYGVATAHTTVGTIGIKVWVYKGDVLPSLVGRADKIAAEARLAAGGPSKRRRRPAKSRAEDAAKAGGDGSGKRIIEAGGGKRLVEAGGGKRRSKRDGEETKVTTAVAKDEFEQARDVAAEVIDGEAAAAVKPSAEAAVKPSAEAVVETPAEAVVKPSAEAVVETPAEAPTVAETPTAPAETPTEDAAVDAVKVDVAETGEVNVPEAAAEGSQDAEGEDA
ncbi:MAG: 30S ribosomal protein S3 [Actinobacteria bacterium]|nr:30S ribosomal protein S3 [Actinomycetota bacterium]